MIDNLINNHYLMDKITIRDKLMNQRGGGNESILNFCFHYIIGLILIVIGFLLYNSQDQWERTIGTIIAIDCNFDACISLIKYSVNNIEFKKNIVNLGKTYKVSDRVEVIYDKTNPNIFKLHEFNYKYIGIIILLIGLFIFVRY